MLDPLLEHRVLFMLGKGGVGRTSLAGAVALSSARAGCRVLAVECDPAAPLARAFGAAPGYKPVEALPNLWLMTLEGQAALRNYLTLTLGTPTLLRAVFASSLYKLFVQAAPGLRELIMIGKIYHEAERRPASLPRWDVVIVDAPPSGHALALLRMPFAAGETFGTSVVGKEARAVGDFMRDRRKFAVVLVTTGERLAVSETLENRAALAALRLEPAAVVINRVPQPGFSLRDLQSLEGTPALSGQGAEAAQLAKEIAGDELRRAERASKMLRFLRRHTHAPTLEIPECGIVSLRETVVELATRASHKPLSRREARI